ncbi:MAG: hypothetical protein HFF18_02760 [Oscillospiraceae bacterium]|nr:hypothetical protein [Oscillospiraceae bacterium]
MGELMITGVNLFGAYMLLTIGCELRCYKGGRRYIKSFRAKTPLQRIYTAWQLPKDAVLGELTYLGYAGVILFHLFGIAVVPYAVFQIVTGNARDAMELLQIWFTFGCVWGVAATFIQAFDSLLNRFLR